MNLMLSQSWLAHNSASHRVCHDVFMQMQSSSCHKLATNSLIIDSFLKEGRAMLFLQKSFLPCQLRATTTPPPPKACQKAVAAASSCGRRQLVVPAQTACCFCVGAKIGSKLYGTALAPGPAAMSDAIGSNGAEMDLCVDMQPFSASLFLSLWKPRAVLRQRSLSPQGHNKATLLLNRFSFLNNKKHAITVVPFPKFDLYPQKVIWRLESLAL